jgi:large repetitive protein
MTSRARVGATLVAVAATATAALLTSVPAQAAPGATPAPTRTTLSASPSTIALGAPAKLKAVVKPVVGSGKPTGTVTFSEGTTVLGTVSLALVGTVETAKLTVNGLAIGDHDFTATYNGSGTFVSSTSLPFTVTVGPAASVTIAGITPAAPRWKQFVTLKGTVKPKVLGLGVPAGSVTFTEGATVLGTAPLVASGSPVSYQAKLKLNTLSIGNHSFVATFVPSGGTLAGSASAPKDFAVSPIAVSVTPDEAFDSGSGTWTFSVQVKGLVAGFGNPTTPDTVTFYIDGLAPRTYALGQSGGANTLDQPLNLDPGSHTVKVVFNPAPGSIFGANQGSDTFTA